MLNIPDYIRNYLLEKKIYQKEFAKLVSINPANISEICIGRRRCGIKLATRIANALNLKDKERFDFLNLVRMPKWKGLENTTNSHETILANVLIKKLASKEIEISSIASVVPTQKETYLIQKDGDVYELEVCLKIKK